MIDVGAIVRRYVGAVGMVLVAGAATLVVVGPASADTPEVAVTLSSSTVHPGDTLTVTETITNVHQFSILQPTARLFSAPTAVAGYTTLIGCTGAASCSTVDGPNGPIGYQGALAEALSGFQAATVTFTLRISPTAAGGTQTMQGQLFGYNYATGVTNGPPLTVVARADVAVRLTGTPQPGLLAGDIDFTVAITNNGPDPLVGATITTTLPAGLSATSAACTPGTGQVVCTFGGLAKGGSATESFTVPVHLLSIGLPYRFTATRTTSSPTDPNSANDTATTTCTALTSLLVSCSSAT